MLNPKPKHLLGIRFVPCKYIQSYDTYVHLPPGHLKTPPPISPESSLAVVAPVIETGSPVYEVLHDGQMPLLCRVYQRVPPVVVHFVDLCALLHQQLADLPTQKGLDAHQRNGILHVIGQACSKLVQ